MTSPQEPRPAYHLGHWQPPSKSLTGGCLLLAGIGVLLYMAGRFKHPNVMEGSSVLWLIGAAMFVTGCALLQKPPRPAVDPVPPPPLPPLASAEAPPVPEVDATPVTPTGGEGLDRVRQLLAGGKFPFELIEEETVYEGGNHLVKYALHALSPGYLSDRRNSTMACDRLQRAVAGDWIVQPFAEIDKVVVKRKTPFPPFVTPPIPARIVASPQEAADRYAQFSVGIGVDELGNELRYRFESHPHWLVIGGTGSGKSVFIRSIIEEIRAAGVPVFIGDGKRSDYTSLLGAPNVPMISMTPAEHVRLVLAVAQEIDRRRVIAAKRKLSGHPNPYEFEPWVMILDELARMRVEVQDTYDGRTGNDSGFLKALEFLFKVGREFKVHVILSTQDLYAKTIPRDILSNCKLVITLGPPADMTLKHAFTDEMGPKARRIGELISAETPGRGLVAVDADGTVQEFQSYFGYSPGLNIDDPKYPDAIRPRWRDYRAQVSDAIPKLYSRQWFAVQTPDDLDLSIPELGEIEMVNLDLINGQPDPQMFCYDKLRDEYNGLSKATARPGELLHIDLTAEPPGPSASAGAPVAEADIEPVPAVTEPDATGPEAVDVPSGPAPRSRKPLREYPALSDKVQSIAAESLNYERGWAGDPEGW